MSRVNTAEEPRYEVKMTCEEPAVPRLLATLRLHPSVIRPLFPDRQVQSIYFDTHAGRALSDNIAGISERQKIRCRWYGPATRGVRGTLERKERFNQLGRKTTLPLPRPIDVVDLPRHRLRLELLEQCDDYWGEILTPGLEPVQWISYRRSYFTTADRRVRITVDVDLEAFDLRFRQTITRDRPSVIPRICVLECKAAASDHELLEEVLAAIPLPPSRCSKFVLASNPEHGPMVSRYW